MTMMTMQKSPQYRFVANVTHRMRQSLTDLCKYFMPRSTALTRVCQYDSQAAAQRLLIILKKDPRSLLRAALRYLNSKIANKF
jgi:hypothetical protein